MNDNPFEFSNATLDLVSAKSDAYLYAMMKNGGVHPTISQVESEISLGMKLKGYHEVCRRDGKTVPIETTYDKDPLMLSLTGHKISWERP